MCVKRAMQQNEFSSIGISAAKRAEGDWFSDYEAAKCFTKFKICMDIDSLATAK
jgi:hypothetical protein